MGLYTRGKYVTDLLDSPRNLISNRGEQNKDSVQEFMNQFMRELSRTPRDDTIAEADPNYDPLGDDYG